MKASRHLLFVLLALCLLTRMPPAAGEPPSMQLLASYHVDGPLEDIAWSPDGARLGVATFKGVAVLNSSDGKPLFSLPPPDANATVTGVRWTPNGTIIFTSYGEWTDGANSVLAWNASTGARLLGPALSGGDTLDISPDGRYRAGSMGSPDKTLGVWGIDSGLMKLAANLPWVEAIAWSPVGQRLAVLEGPLNLTIWDMSDGTRIECDATSYPMNLTSISWSPDGSMLMAGVEYEDIAPGASFNLAVFNTTDGLKMGGSYFNNSDTISVAWSVDGILAAGEVDGSIYLTGYGDGWTEARMLGYHPNGSVVSLAWSPDGKLLASGSPDGSVCIWGMTGSLPSKPRLDLAFTADRISAAGGERFKLALRVLDERAAPVLGATIALSSGAGGNFSAVTDSGGGNYTASFTAPKVQSNTTILLSARAILAGFEPAEAGLQLKVLPAPAARPFIEPGVHTDDGTGAILVISGGTILLVVAALAITESGKYSGMFLIIPLYTRMKKQTVLDNFSRGQLHGYILANPGVHMNAIRDRFGLSNGEVAYHLRVLEREGLVSSMSDGLRRRFYPGEGGARERPQELTFAQTLLITVMEKSPGITGSELSRATGTSPQVVNYHLKKLWRMDLITMDRDGRVVRCFVRPEKLGLFKRASDQKEALPGETLYRDSA